MKKLENLKQYELIAEIERLRTCVKELENSKTSLKQVNDEFSESILGLRAILNNTVAIIYVKDIAGKYIFVNKRYEEVFHLTSNDVLGKTDYDIHTKEIADKFVENDKKILEFEASLEFEEEASLEDGVHNYISLKFPIFKKTGEVYAVCGISTDITLRKHAEFEKEKLISELKATLAKVKLLNGLVPICSICKRMRDDHGYWRAVEKYVEENSNIKFTDGMCPECYEQFHGETEKNEE